MKVSISSTIIFALATYYRFTDALPITLHPRGDTAPATPDYPVVDIVDPAALFPDTVEGDEGGDNLNDDDNEEDDTQPSRTNTPSQFPTVTATLVPVVNVKATSQPSTSTTAHLSPSHATPSELSSSDPSSAAPLISPSTLPPSSVTATPLLEECESTTLSPTETCPSSTLSLELTATPTPATSDTSPPDSCLEDDLSTTLNSLMMSTTPVPLPTGAAGPSPKFHHGYNHTDAPRWNGTAASRFSGDR